MKHVLTVAVLLASCATTEVHYRSELVVSDALLDPTRRRTFDLEGTLDEAHLHCDADLHLDRSFETRGFSAARPPFSVTRGDRCVAAFYDDPAEPATALFVSMEPGGEARTLTDGELIPSFFAIRRVGGQTAAVVCKGGTGRFTRGDGGGSLALTVVCRSYVNGQEREETTASIRGTFLLQSLPSDAVP